MINFFNYIERESPVHRLTGATKLICLILRSGITKLFVDCLKLLA